jgi:hypothetical protein
LGAWVNVGSRNTMQVEVEPLAIEGGTPVRSTYLVFGKPLITNDEIMGSPPR